LPISANGADDEARIGAAQFLASKSEPLKGARLQVLDDNIRLLQEIPQGLLSTGRCDIEDKGFLAAIEPNEIASLTRRGILISAREITFQAHDFDDTGAGISKPRGAVGRGNRLFDGHNRKAFKRKTWGAHQNDLGKPSTCSAT